MKLIAIDQATTNTGYSIWEDSSLMDYGQLSSDPKEKNPIERINQMYFLIKDLLIKQQVDFVIIENVQFQQNYRTYAQLSQLQGTLFAIFFDLNVGFVCIEPSAWRKFSNIKGAKRAEQKLATIQMVKERFNLDVSEDIADAIGIGLWGVNNVIVDDKK